MSEDGMKKIFKPYMQADKDTFKKFGGTGLGLCICSEIV